MAETYLFLQIAAAVGMLIASASYAYSKVARSNHEETKELAERRLERIQFDEERLAELERQVAQLEGQMEAIQRIKAQEIAVEVARLLKVEIRALNGDEYAGQH